MKTIPAVANTDGVLSPAASIPPDAVAVVCDGTMYTVYQPGDAVPMPPIESTVEAGGVDE